jgi:dihydrofolate reductase (trimethoprim resistance protein)
METAFWAWLKIEESLALPFLANSKPIPQANTFTFKHGDLVRKKSGSEWQGHIVGWYSTGLTPVGYAVESDSHAGSVQIYPASALKLVL